MEGRGDTERCSDEEYLFARGNNADNTQQLCRLHCTVKRFEGFYGVTYIMCIPLFFLVVYFPSNISADQFSVKYAVFIVIFNTNCFNGII